MEQGREKVDYLDKTYFAFECELDKTAVCLLDLAHLISSARWQEEDQPWSHELNYIKLLQKDDKAKEFMDDVKMSLLGLDF